MINIWGSSTAASSPSTHESAVRLREITSKLNDAYHGRDVLWPQEAQEVEEEEEAQEVHEEEEGNDVDVVQIYFLY